VAARGIGAMAKALGHLGFRESADLAETWRSFVSLEDPEARRAFLTTVMGIIDLGGQRVSAVDKLYLASDLPMLIVWGRRDPLIPVAHAYRAHQVTPNSRLEIFPSAGHYPYLDEPEHFAAVLLDFIRTTRPQELDPARLRSILRTGAVAPAAVPPAS
jgi:pimeloyl-ACP methyl ester carboxylesterase